MAPRRRPPEERFWAKVRRGPGCWLWTAAVDKDGYPIFQAEPTLTRRGTRWLWEHLHGSIPAGQVICHRCDRPSCVRPDHLFLG